MQMKSARRRNMNTREYHSYVEYKNKQGNRQCQMIKLLKESYQSGGEAGMQIDEYNGCWKRDFWVQIYWRNMNFEMV